MEAVLPALRVEVPHSDRIAGTPKPQGYGRKNAYTASEKAQALAEVAICNGNTRLASKRCGVARQTLSMWKRTEADLYRDIRLTKREQIFGDLAERMQDLGRKAAQQADKRLPDASARDAAVVMGIALQRSNELVGTVQQHLHVHRMAPEQLDQEIEKVAQKLAAIDAESEEVA